MQLGETGIDVSRLSLGGLFVSSYGAAFDQAKATISRALALGVNYIDTAPMYRDSETVLGRALQDVASQVILSTKFGYKPEPFAPKDAGLLLRSFENSLRILGRDRIDILMIHEPDRTRQFDWWDDFTTATGPVFDVLAELKADGKVTAIGVAGTTAYLMARLIETGRFDVVLSAFNYSLLWREAEHELLPAARAAKTGVVIGSPLQQGALARRWEEVREGALWLSKPRREQFQALYRFVDDVEIPLPELAVRFTLSHPSVHTVLMGARSPEEVAQNVAATNAGPLPDGVLARLDEIAAMVPFRPFDEPFTLPFGREWPGAWPAR